MPDFSYRFVVLQHSSIEVTHWLINVFNLVTPGEVNAGKSTFLNLLFHGLGIELPNSEKETTSCVCEIKHGKEKKVTVHRRKPKDGEADTFDVDPVTNEVLNELINFEALKQTPSKLPYKKIEIFLPSEFLQVNKYRNAFA